MKKTFLFLTTVFLMLLVCELDSYAESFGRGGGIGGATGGMGGGLPFQGGFGAMGSAGRGGSRGGMSGDRGRGGRGGGGREPDWLSYWGVYTGCAYIFDDLHQKVGYATEFGLVMGFSDLFEFAVVGFSDMFRNDDYIIWDMDNKREAYGIGFNIRFGLFGFKLFSISPKGNVKFFRTSDKASDKGKGGKRGSKSGQRGRGMGGKGRGGATPTSPRSGSPMTPRGGGMIKQMPSATPVERSAKEFKPGQAKNKKKSTSKKEGGSEKGSTGKKGEQKDKKNANGKGGKKERDEEAYWFDIGITPYIELGMGIESSSVPFVRSTQAIGLKINFDNRFGLYGKYSIIEYSSLFTKDLIGKMYGIYVAYYF